MKSKIAEIEKDIVTEDATATKLSVASNTPTPDADQEELPLDDLTGSEMDEDIIPKQKLIINNKTALKELYKEIKLDVPWIETQAVTLEEPTQIKDVNNDMERELAFYKQALQSTATARSLCQSLSVPFSRPSDYFAEMVKSDELMSRVRQRLLDEDAQIKASEQARKQRESKKFGKKVQFEKLQERQKKKSEELEKIKTMKKKRKGIEDTAIDDDFEIALEEAAREDRPVKRQKIGKSTKRSRKDAKFGFGGKKKYAKSNTAQSTADISDFNPRAMKGGWGVKKKPKNYRLGKTRRQAMKSRKRG
ncbi:3302_t:CDS:2 [Paraglomus occultum]|uniref:3302_t:CDS:1 n=1 Tax=Paraglomus occultum TaxID=144539 RepID=A0A9N9FF70_9GLOM|nr:3302_t:CDS:2 [Paraglomus occultum]